MASISVLPQPTAAFEALVDAHVLFCDATAPPGSCHRLPVSALFSEDLTVWIAEEDGVLLGMGALKEFDLGGEIKSMHTAAQARGKGVARAVLDAVILEANHRGYGALWLETGVHSDFAPARALYAAYGFSETDPFGSYTYDPHSVFMTKSLKESDQGAST